MLLLLDIAKFTSSRDVCAHFFILCIIRSAHISAASIAPFNMNVAVHIGILVIVYMMPKNTCKLASSTMSYSRYRALKTASWCHVPNIRVCL